MKKLTAICGTCAALALAGCCNAVVRTEKPYAAAPRPYYCTASTWDDCVCAPWRVGSSHDPVWTAFATLTWPLWLVDLPCEAALDTAFLPVDLWAIRRHQKENTK